MDRRQFLKSSAAAMATFVTYQKIGISASFAAIPNSGRIENKSLTLSFVLTNPREVVLKNQRFYIYLPANSARQRLKSVDSSNEYTLETDRLDQNIIMFEFPVFKPLSIKTIAVSAMVETFQMEDKNIIKADDWLQSERLIESGNPQLKILASQLKRDTDVNTCYAIYQWVSDNLTYTGYIADNLGAQYAVEKLKGDCTEYACLIVALARANGIPARVVGGYVIASDTVVQAKNYHHWSEIYFDGQWQLVDAQKRNWLAAQESYIAFNFYHTRHSALIEAGKRYELSRDLRLTY
jgi:hypothetical protein